MNVLHAGCDCAAPGFCPRYQREMHGREFDICRGVGVDAGDAIMIRGQWVEESRDMVEATKAEPTKAEPVEGKPYKLRALTGNIKPNPPPVSVHQPATPSLPMTGTKCPHLGEPVRDKDGEHKKRSCGSCGNNVKRQVFPCQHPARRPDEVTMEDCSKCDYRPKDESTARVVILKNHLSPGDVLVMTAAIHSLHQAHPGKFLTAVDTTAPAVFDHNPHVISIDRARELKAEEIQTHYPAIHQSNERGIHFMQGYTEFFAAALGVPVPLLTNRPHVYLSHEERTWMDQVHELTKKKQRFWLVCAGRKADYTTKFWGTSGFQEVVDSLRGKVQFVQVGSKDHHHPPLRGVLDFVGKTDLRQLIRLCWHADGVLSGVTFLQHLAAAWQKPSVVVMGGREPVLWNSYPRQQLLHTVGSLSCCKAGGCWKSRVVPLNDGDEKDRSLCENPTFGVESVPKCMALIRPAEVAEKILLNFA